METDTSPAPTVFFRPAEPTDLPTLAAMEAASYPPDEAASPERLAFRLEHAPDFFLAAVTTAPISATAATANGTHEPAPAPTGDLQVIGFVCGTLITASTLTHESMATHEEDGALLCIHSVCVTETQRKQGVGSRLMKAYVSYVKQARPDVEAMRLLCKEHLVKFYQGAGFTVVGPSPVVHGEDQWIEMVLEL